VWLAIDGVPGENAFDPPPDQPTASQGSQSATILVGKTYHFRLRDDQGKDLVDLDVVAQVVSQQIGPLPDPRMHQVDENMFGNAGLVQQIRNLVVTPGFETAVFSFSTTQAAVPNVTIYNAPPLPGPEQKFDMSAFVDFEVPTYPTEGPRTDHNIKILPILNPGTTYYYEVVAESDPEGSPARVVDNFTTMVRQVIVHFDSVKLWQRPTELVPLGTAGFNMAAFFLSHPANAGAWRDAVLLGDSVLPRSAYPTGVQVPLPISASINIDNAPQTLTLTANGWDFDPDASYSFGFSCGDVAGVAPGGGGPDGFVADVETASEFTWFVDGECFAWSNCLTYAYFDSFSGPQSQPFYLATRPDAALRYEIYGHVETILPPSARSLRVGRPPVVINRTATALYPGRLAVVGYNPNRRDLFSRGPDGAVLYRMFLTGAQRQQDKWRVIADGVAGPITAVAGTDGRLDLFAIGSEGRVLHRCTPNGTWPSKGEWQNLGGNFAGPVIAVPGDDAKIHLLAAASDGGVRHLWLDLKAQARPSNHWSNLGGKVARSLAAVSLKSGSLDIVGLAADGAVLHGRVKVGNGKLGPARWVNLGGQFQGVACGYADKGGLEILTYAADRSLHRMTIEREAAKGRWVNAGTLDSPQHDASRVEVAKRKSVDAKKEAVARRR
jgi:hypothetical protein